jgi:alanyl aminopeptidase
VMRLDALATARAIRQPLTEMARVLDQFDAMSYEKGLGVLSMFERWVGPEPFRAGIEAYLRSRAHGSGSTDEFLFAIERASGKSVSQAFHSFLDQAGVPLVEAGVRCDAQGARLSLEQARYLPVGSEGSRDRVWQVPVCARWSAGGDEREACTLLAARTGELNLGDRCPDWVLPNTDAAGYYRWSLPAQDLASLRSRGYSRLSVRERISLADNIAAAMRAGTLAFADGLLALEPVARDPDPEVAEEPIGLLRSAHDDLVPERLRPRLRAYAAALYGPAFRRVGWTPIANEGVAQRRFRKALIEFLAFTVRDPEVVARAARLGTEYAGIGGADFRPEAVSPDLAATVLSIAVRESTPALFDLLEERLRTLDDGEVRERVLAALASATDAQLAKRAAALSVDARLRANERVEPLFWQAYRPETREVAWAALQSHFDELVPKLENWSAGALPNVARRFCDPQRAVEVKAFFEPRIAKVPQAKQNLEQALESIRLCAAYKAAQEASAVAFFERPAAVSRVPTGG